MITEYEALAFSDMRRWQQRMQLKPSLLNRMSTNLQKKVNRVIPEKVHKVMTEAIKQMTKGLITGAGIISPEPLSSVSLETREIRSREAIALYKRAAAVEGGVTGAGGILLGLADFPLWLSIKIKMLLEIAAAYGHDVKDPAERMYILQIFQLAFSSQQHRNKVYEQLVRWITDERTRQEQPDWRAFQLEYRDYIDLAKLMQLIPGIGAVVGVLVNHQLTNQLGETAMNAYRLRAWMGSDRLKVEG